MQFEKLGQEIGKLVEEKNKAYGDSFAKCGEFLKLLYPDGIKREQYNDVLSIARVFDKLMRIANKKDAFGESPWKDIAGYGILGAANDKPNNKDCDHIIKRRDGAFCVRCNEVFFGVDP